MKLPTSHTLITAYSALATVAIGLVGYSALVPEPKRSKFTRVTIESVTKGAATDSDSVNSEKTTEKRVAAK